MLLFAVIALVANALLSKNQTAPGTSAFLVLTPTPSATDNGLTPPASSPVQGTDTPTALATQAGVAGTDSTADIGESNPPTATSPASSSALRIPTAQSTATAIPNTLTPSVPPYTFTPAPEVKSATPQLPLSGRRIALDPGHGVRGDLGVVLLDPTTGKLILSAAEFNLDVALRCRDILVARGASVVLTRNSADTLNGTWPADANGDGVVGAAADDLQERIDIINNFHAEAFLSIQANGGVAAPPSSQDLQVIYCGTEDCRFAAQSRELGQLVLDRLQKGLASVGYTAGGQLLTDTAGDTSASPQHLFLLGPANPPQHPRASGMPGVMSESLYVSSPQEAAQLNKSSVRQAIALAYADALQAYLTGVSGGGT